MYNAIHWFEKAAGRTQHRNQLDKKYISQIEFSILINPHLDYAELKT